MKKNNKAVAQKTVVALHFDGVNAPTVSAKGSGLTGEKILQLAQEHGIPLHENSYLAKTLSCIPLGDEIPAEVFTVVAEILAYIYFVDGMQPTINSPDQASPHFSPGSREQAQDSCS